MSDPVAQFMAVTNASAADAAAYLEATGGDVDAAVEAFFDAGGGGGESAEPAAGECVEGCGVCGGARVAGRRERFAR